MPGLYLIHLYAGVQGQPCSLGLLKETSRLLIYKAISEKGQSTMVQFKRGATLLLQRHKTETGGSLLEGLSWIVSLGPFGSSLEKRVKRRGAGAGTLSQIRSLLPFTAGVKWEPGGSVGGLQPNCAALHFYGSFLWKGSKCFMNLAIDFLSTAPQDAKQGHHYGLCSLKELLKTV